MSAAPECNGTYWFADGELRSDRALELTRIPLAKVTGLTIGTWHAGKWLAGKPIVKVGWEADGGQLSSGFGFADHQNADAIVAELQARRSGTG